MLEISKPKGKELLVVKGRHLKVAFLLGLKTRRYGYILWGLIMEHSKN